MQQHASQLCGRQEALLCRTAADLSNIAFRAVHAHQGDDGRTRGEARQRAVPVAPPCFWSFGERALTWGRAEKRITRVITQLSSILHGTIDVSPQTDAVVQLCMSVAVGSLVACKHRAGSLCLVGRRRGDGGEKRRRGQNTETEEGRERRAPLPALFCPSSKGRIPHEVPLCYVGCGPRKTGRAALRCAVQESGTRPSQGKAQCIALPRILPTACGGILHCPAGHRTPLPLTLTRGSSSHAMDSTARWPWATVDRTRGATTLPPDHSCEPALVPSPSSRMTTYMCHRQRCIACAAVKESGPCCLLQR